MIKPKLSKIKKIRPYVKKKKTSVSQSQATSIASSSPPSVIKEYLHSLKPVHKKELVETYQLPSRYQETYLTLIARDPYWIYAYWEISPQSIEAMKRKMGDKISQSSYVLRMYELSLVDFNGHNANHWFDIEVGLHAANWYINLCCDHVTYCSEMGLRTPEGEFFPLTRSNVVTTPRANLSGRGDLIWMEVKANHKNNAFVHVAGSSKRSGLSHRSKENLIKPRRKIFLSEADIRWYYSQISPFLKNILPKLLGKKGSKSPELKGGNYTLEDTEGLSENILRQVRSRYWKIFKGASEEFVAGEGASERMLGASEREEVVLRRGFFFELATELIVYGRTEPDARVHWGARKIPLNPEGTFSLRMALPDGNIPLDFLAESKDQLEKRRITTAVERTKTIYSSE